MKALFRLFVLCFFLLRFGLGFAHQHAKVESHAVVLDQTFISNSTPKKESSVDFCPIEVNLELITSVENQDLPIQTIDLSDAFYFFMTSVFELAWTKPLVGAQQVAIVLQQHRAKYLLYQSIKIPHRLA